MLDVRILLLLLTTSCGTSFTGYLISPTGQSTDGIMVSLYEDNATSPTNNGYELGNRLYDRTSKDGGHYEFPKVYDSGNYIVITPSRYTKVEIYTYDSKYHYVDDIDIDRTNK